MRYVAAMLFCAATGMAQQVTTPDRLPDAVSAFAASQNHDPLPCEVQPLKPVLNFGFRFQAGYLLESSLDPYIGEHHRWSIVFRVTPEDSGGNANQPVYFYDSLDLPAAHEAGFIAQNTGAFQLGEGRYDVKWSMFDDLGRVCRKEWTIDAHLSSRDRSEKVAMPPNTAGDFSWRPAQSAKAAAKSRRVTILLNAAMPKMRVRRGQPAADQWGMLLSILSSVVEQIPEASVRVVAFDTDQQKELFRKNDFTPADMNDVAALSNAKERWAVDYHALQNPQGGWDLLRDVENAEIRSASRADAVIFLGARDPRFGKMPPGMPGKQSAPRFFYLQYGRVPANPQSAIEDIGMSPRTMGRGGGALTPPDLASQPDLIEQSVRQLGGKAFPIAAPADLNKALKAIGR